MVVHAATWVFDGPGVDGVYVVVAVARLQPLADHPGDPHRGVDAARGDQGWRRGLQHIAAERLVAAPDCGMKYLPRDVAFGKLRALAEGAALVRRELAG